MYKHLLVPIDGSKLSGKAVAQALDLAESLQARITVFYAAPEFPMPTFVDAGVYSPMSKAQYSAHAAREAESVLAPVRAKAQKRGIECETMHAMADAPWEAILAAAKKTKCDAVVMASHGRRGVTALLLGSETQKVLTHSKLPVLVVR